ncbi:MAG: carbohydrate-binding domain-containing protein [Eubacteriales bacterium]|nr:carbohydrate-binding domain-containing protein [Eubacteriales bacterium]
MKKAKFFLSLISLSVLTACGGTDNTSSVITSSSSPSSSAPISSSTISDSTSSNNSGSEYDDTDYVVLNVDDYLTSTLLTQMDNAVTLPSTYKTMTKDDTSITEAGSYYFKGDSFTSVSIALTAKGSVVLYLDGATFTAKSKAITVEDEFTESVTIVLLNNSSNTITAKKNAVDVTCDLYVVGSGTLSITSTGKSCLKSEKGIYLKDITLNLTASGDGDGHGISGSKVLAKGATIQVNDSGKDGIHSEMEDSVTAFTKEDGYVVFEDVKYIYTYANASTDETIGSGDGIQADTFVLIDSSTVNLTTGSMMVAYSSALVSSGDYEADDFKYTKNGDTYSKVASEQRGRDGTYAIVNSCKGIKVGVIDYEDASGNTKEVASSSGEEYTLQITSSTLTLNTFDDGLHVNQGQMIVEDSSITASCSDQPLSADGAVILKNNTIDITKSYEGIQGSQVAIYGSKSDISVVAEDDGINAASDYYTDNLYISVNGGKLNVVSGGDGLDSNGYSYFNAGTINVECSESGTDSPLDTDKGYYMNGATVIASGSAAMIENPQNDSTAYTIMAGATYTAGTTFTLTDSDGNTVLTTTTKKAGGAIILSSPSLSSGKTYTLTSGTTTVGSVTISSKVSTIGSIQQGPGQGGEPGGGQRGPGGPGQPGSHP